MKRLIFCGSLAALTASAFAADYTATEGDWSFTVKEDTHKLYISHADKKVFNGAYAEVVFNFLGDETDHTISSLDPQSMPAITVEDADDCFGQGKTYILTYEGEGGVMEHRLSFYPSLPYMIAQVTVSAADGRKVQSRSLKALAVSEYSQPLNGIANRAVWVPFDNDGFVRYQSYVLKNDEEMPSHEVGYVFDGNTRRGIIAGSVDHDNWKSAVTIAGTSGYRINKFECLSGFTNFFTRDILPHGKVKGDKVGSSRFFVGVYDDWRQGLNDFADANTKVAPRAEWTGGNPMGWSSWGSMQNYINYDGVYETAHFIKEQLYDLGFHDLNGQTVISLDAFAGDNIPRPQIAKLGTKVFGEGTYRDGFVTKQGTNQRLGQYGGHLVVWSWTLGSQVDGTGLNGTPNYTWDDVALRHNGELIKVNSNGAYAIDPTHPGVQALLEKAMRSYADTGTKYLKFDFLNNGIIEGDSWYNPEITTGVQAYNYSMKMLRELAEKYGMYVVESISPLFPYQYAHGRRTTCDAWGLIGESEYVMNAMTYGWWTDRLYTVNDPDHMVMHQKDNLKRETIGENRARATSGMATGAFIFGDNLSDKVLFTDDASSHSKGDVVGYPDASRERILTLMGNADINDYVRNNIGSFMPVDGHHATKDDGAETVFMRNTGKYLYVAVFNFKSVLNSRGTVTFERLGIDGSSVESAKELWLNEPVEMDADGFSYMVPAKDARVYRFTLKDGAGVESVVADKDNGAATVQLLRTGYREYQVISTEAVASVEAFAVSGQKVASAQGAVIDLSAAPDGIYMVKATLASGTTATVKTVNR